MVFQARFEISLPGIGRLGFLARLERAEFPVRRWIHERT